jgi:tetratricopeptide (TPR) repeat protein
MELGLAYYLKGKYEDAIRTLQIGLARNPDFVGNYIAVAAAYAQTGRSEKAARAAEKVLRLHPFFEIESYGAKFRNQEDLAAIIAGLKKAGLK